MTDPFREWPTLSEKDRSFQRMTDPFREGQILSENDRPFQRRPGAGAGNKYLFSSLGGAAIAVFVFIAG